MATLTESLPDELEDDATPDDLETLDIPAPDVLPAGRPARTIRRRRTTPDGEPKAPRTPRAPRRSSSSKAPKIGESMAGLYTMLGMGLAAIPSLAGKGLPDVPATQAIGLAIVQNSAACGAAWEKAAAEDDRVRVALEKLLVASVFTQLVAAHMPILVMVGLTSGAIPAEVAAFLGAGQDA